MSDDAGVVKDLLLQVLSKTAELHEGQTEIKIVGQQTLAQATRTNGRVDKLELWQHAVDQKFVHEDAVAAGRKAQRQDDLAVLGWFQRVVADWWPLILGAALGGVGVGSFLWSVLR